MGKALSPAQRAMILMSAPDDITGKEGLGVELRTAQQYSTAKALMRRRLGLWHGGDALPGMYWSNGDGLCMRKELLERHTNLRSWRAQECGR